MNIRPPIPLPMQRSIRQRCGFGCVLCGMPLYEYDHLYGYDESRGHVQDEITLLCDQHHKEKTTGLLPLDAVVAANAQPFNHRSGVSKPYDLHFEGSECKAVIGGNYFTTTDIGYGTLMVPLSIDGIPIVGFVLGDGHLLLNLNLFDEFNLPVLRVVNNVLVYRASAWDVELVGHILTVREAKRKVLAEITFAPPGLITVTRGRFLCNGVEVLIRPEYLLITNNAMLLSNCSAQNCPGGLIIGQNAGLSGFMSIENIPRYLGDHSQALKWAREVINDFGSE